MNRTGPAAHEDRGADRPATPAALPPTLGQRLLRHVLVPLAITWVAGTVVSIAVAQVFAQRAFDHSLLDDAYLLATNVHEDNGRVHLNLTPAEIRNVLFDQAETVYFSVRRSDGSLIAGDPDLQMVARPGDENHAFDHIAFNGKLLRAVTLHRDHPRSFDVAVAQTTSGRDALLRQLLLDSLLPQLVLLLALGWWLHRSIRRDVQPLATLRQAVADRGADDLAPVAVQASTRDVQALAGAINALLQRLEHSVRAQREFAGNVAHELRTPLAGIRALAGYGLAQNEPQVWREQLAAVAASEARASALVDRLLALALAHEAESRLTLQPVPLDRIVRDAVLRFLRRADADGVDLGARGIESPVWVAGDSMLLEGVLDNLLDNALRYGRPADGATATVTVALERRGDQVLLFVQDNGPGVPGALQAALVARGTQGEAGQLLGQGAGLGLALVAQYARLLRGHMRLHSGEAGRGWVCEITLRAVSPPA
ncbi:sensor histidine kinase [Ramlibacter sp.]|uniref:sensor histidine kinase n=1 Tax=Ramlibacter sp. TaxID=1917967 RepID=UPI002603A1E8|nr:sensor histidine kinase [Ramlibacter sp.]MDB5958014.1 integral rane sensor signal transduction histidine kinase [Ramlibacter sp.]